MSYFRRALFFVILILVVSAACVFAEPAPSLSIAEPEYDFGTIYQGEKVTHEFSFVNTGDAPLVIDRVKSSCGCTAALLSAKTIKPGETGTIKAIFNSSRFKHAVQKVIFLYSNAVGMPTARFVIKGLIKPVIEFSPELVDFGRVGAGEEKSMSVSLVNQGEKELRIENIRTSNVALEATSGSETLKPGTEVEMTVYARPQNNTPHLRGYILIRTDNSSLGELRLQVSGFVNKPETK